VQMRWSLGISQPGQLIRRLDVTAYIPAAQTDLAGHREDLRRLTRRLTQRAG